MIKYILMDIEGTTSSIDFVHKTLFPYSTKRIESYLQNHQNEGRVQKALHEFKENLAEGSQKDLSLQDIVVVAKKLIQDDIKYGPLKTIQGFIWEQGYKAGEIKGHVYPEVPQVIKSWIQKDIKLGIYSSGSVLAQKLIFGYTEFGDLTPSLSHFFDTAVGGKKEATSYENISGKIHQKPENTLFLSDRPEELQAAKKAGFQVILVNRDGAHFENTSYKQVENFSQIIL